MKRWAVLAVGLSLTAFTLVAPARSAQPMQLGHQVRFDVVHVVQGTLLAGGTAIGKDGPTEDTVSLTASGGVKPATADAAGGGTFVHKHANGTEVASGVWVVVSFVSWAPAGGSLATLGVTDGIGETSEASSGILTLNVRLFPLGKSPTDATLEIHCNLPGASFSTEEGIRLIVGTFVFEQDGGNGTVFHILE